MKNKIIKYIFTLFIASMGLVSVLAWNDAVKLLFETIYPIDKNGLFMRFLYATIITIVTLIFTAILSSFIYKDDDKK